MNYNVHLCGGLGYFDETSGEMVDAYSKKVAGQSPAIDAGNPKSDYSREPQLQGIGGHGRRVNLGAYGNTPWATLSRIPGFFIILR